MSRRRTYTFSLPNVQSMYDDISQGFTLIKDEYTATNLTREGLGGWNDVSDSFYPVSVLYELAVTGSLTTNAIYNINAIATGKTYRVAFCVKAITANTTVWIGPNQSSSTYSKAMVDITSATIYHQVNYGGITADFHVVQLSGGWVFVYYDVVATASQSGATNFVLQIAQPTGWNETVNGWGNIQSPGTGKTIELYRVKILYK